MDNAKKKSIAKTVTILVAVVAVVLGLTLHKFLNKPILSKEQLQQMGAVMFEKPRTFAFDGLVDHNGQPFTADILNDRWSIFYFGFTYCPDICPVTLTELNKLDGLLKEKSPNLAKQMQYIMVSVDPKRDTAEKLKNYVPHFNNDFIGVTGDITNIYNLTSQMNVPFTPVVDSSNDSYHVDHGGNLILVDPQGNYHGFIRPPFDANQLMTMMEAISKL